jgi:hypothetical protein
VTPGATLILDVGTQCDLWPGGCWPLLGEAEAERAVYLCRLAGTLGVRSGGVYCAHGETVAGLPRHCEAGSDGAARCERCPPARREQVWAAEAPSRTLDRSHAVYLTTGCSEAVDREPGLRAVFDHMTAGVRDAVVFGAGLELGVARVVEALLARRIRTHLALDASGAVDDAEAQTLLGGWKRRTLDVVTTATVARLLGGAGAP